MKTRMFDLKRTMALAALALSFAAVRAPIVSADAAFAGEKWVDTLKFGGDFRLRHESFFNKTAGQVDRHRERMRLRFGAVATIQDVTAGLRLASGTGEQTSTNQTFGNGFNQKNIYIDQAYLQWKAHEYIKLTGGRMPNPFWRVYSSDIMWDTDVNPEGYAESFEVPAGGRLSLFSHFAQMPLNEVSGSQRDPWMFGNQLGGAIKMTEDLKLRIGVAHYWLKNERQNVIISTAAFDSPVLQEGNTRVPGSAQLAGSFNILDYTAELAFHLFTLPVSVQGDYVRNVAKSDGLVVKGQNKGYQYGAIFGKAKNPGSLEVGYFYKYAEANSALSDFSDSDFGNGGTNRKGHIIWIGYALREYLTLQGKYFMTRRLNPMINAGSPFNTAAAPTYRDINRFQFDLVAKF
jgi:hypothetical protein